MVDALAPLKQQGRITEFCCTVAEWYNSESLLKPDNVETCTKGLSWLFIASYFSIWVLTARCSHLGFICTKGVVIFSGGGRGPVRVKFWSATRPWNSGTRLDEMNELVPPETWPTPQNATWSYSASSPNGHSRKQKALLYGHLHKMSFFSTPIQTLYFYIPLSSQPQLQTPFLLPEGVHLRELPLYLKFRLGTYKPLPQRASGEGARKILSPLSPK